MSPHSTVAPRRRAARRTLAAVIGTATALTLVACSSDSSDSSSSGGLADGLGSRAENRDVYFFTYYNPASDAFWNQMLTGAKDAAKQLNLKLTDQTAEGDSAKMTDLISSATATKPAAIFVPFNDPAWEGAACEAAKSGIDVYAFNVPPTDANRGCIQAFVGQDFRQVGQLVGQTLIEKVSLNAGDKVLCPAEEPDQQYAIQRGGGVEDALKAKGVKCTYLRTSGADEEALNSMTTWLSANQDVKAVVPLGGTPHRNAVAAEDAASVKAPIIGFDTSPQVIDGIKSGRILATADQQGYIQGYQSVMQGGLALDFGLAPADINSGGNLLITKDNVGNLEDPKLQGVRW